MVEDKGQDLQRAIEQETLLASRRMVIIEALEDKSDDYIRGFFEGFKLGEDWICESLLPGIKRLEQTIDSCLKSQPRQS